MEIAAPGLGKKVTYPLSLFSGFNHMPGPFYTPTPKCLTRSVLSLLRQVFWETTFKRDAYIYPSNTSLLWLLVEGFDFLFL